MEVFSGVDTSFLELCYLFKWLYTYFVVFVSVLERPNGPLFQYLKFWTLAQVKPLQQY